MLLAWIGLLLEILIFTIIRPMVSDYEVVSMCLIGVNAILVLIGIAMYHKEVKVLLFCAYVFRLVVMFWDIYGRKIFIFPNSGGDSEGYMISAAAIATNFKLLSTSVFGGFYAKFLGILFTFTGQERLIAQYVNVLLGLTTIVLLYKTLQLIHVEGKALTTSITLIAFFPNTIIFSGILLRECITTTFVTLSFYFFIKWYTNRSYTAMFGSVLFLLMASAFHAGVIGILIGYMFFYMFYDHKVLKFKFSYKTVLIFLAFIIIGVGVTQYSGTFLGKFGNVQAADDVYAQANASRGKSAYLPSMEIKSFADIILFGPIKMFYFLASPLPMNWRGVSDIVAFFIDSSIYIWILLFAGLNLKYVKKKSLTIGIVVILLCISFIFGIGVSNAGTAMRHRQKIFPIIVALYAIVTDGKRKHFVMLAEKEVA